MEKEIISNHFGEEKANEIVKLTKAYDNYVAKFKKKLNKLLGPDYEVKTGIAFVDKSKTS